MSISLDFAMCLHYLFRLRENICYCIYVIVRLFSFCHNGKELSVLVGEVFGAVVVSLGAVVHFSRLGRFLLSVSSEGDFSLQYEHYLAVALMGVQTDAAARLQNVAHNLHLAVVGHSCKERSVAALEAFDVLLFDVVEIDNHGFVLL